MHVLRGPLHSCSILQTYVISEHGRLPSLIVAGKSHGMRKMPKTSPTLSHGPPASSDTFLYQRPTNTEHIYTHTGNILTAHAPTLQQTTPDEQIHLALTLGQQPPALPSAHEPLREVDRLRDHGKLPPILGAEGAAEHRPCGHPGMAPRQAPRPQAVRALHGAEGGSGGGEVAHPRRQAEPDHQNLMTSSSFHWVPMPCHSKSKSKRKSKRKRKRKAHGVFIVRGRETRIALHWTGAPSVQG